MRSAYLLLILVIAVHVSDNLAGEVCPEENCMPSSRCEVPWHGAQCTKKSATCCSIVKAEYRNACRHYGGECLSNCNKNLQRSVSNCPANTVCCVLV